MPSGETASGGGLEPAFLPGRPSPPPPPLTLSAGKAHTRFPGNDGVWELLGWNRNRPGERLVSVVCFVNQTSESRLGLGMRKAGLWE